MEQKSLHVGFLTNEYIIPTKNISGGLASYIKKVSRSLHDRGHQVSVFCLSDRDHHWSDEGVNIYEVKSKFTGFPRVISQLFSPKTDFREIITNSSRLAKRVIKVNSKEPLHIVQSTSYKSVGIMLCNNSSIHLVTRISNFSPAYRNTGKVGDNVNTISTALTDWCEIYQLENSDQSFSPSKLMADYFSLFSQAKPLIIRTPFEPVDVNLDNAFFKRNLQQTKYLLYFGTLNRMKGLEVISKSLEGLVAEYPDLHFVFIGRTHKDENNRSYADKILQSSERIKNNLHYIPALSKEELFPIVQHAYGILIPSLVDNYPNTCLESMQFGKIVIGTYGSSLEEIIYDGETGFLVQKNEVIALQTGIRKLLNLSSDQKEEMERNIIKRFDLMLSEDRIQQLVDFYFQTIEDYKHSTTETQLTWERLFFLNKYYGLRVGYLSQIFRNLSKIVVHFQNWWGIRSSREKP